MLRCLNPINNFYGNDLNNDDCSRHQGIHLSTEMRCNATELIAESTKVIGIDHNTVCTGVVCAVRPHECCAGVATNHNCAGHMSGQFLFYHENEAIHCDKCNDDEPPCWHAPGWQRHWDGSVPRNSVRISGQYDVTIGSGSCIDDVTITRLFSFEIVSGATRNERYDFRLFKM